MVATRHDLSVILEFVGIACHSLFRELIHGSQKREQKMTSGENGLYIFMLVACILWAICSYAVGYKEGHKDGYQRGKAVGRHASSQAVR